jgi:hypothetical protein
MAHHDITVDDFRESRLRRLHVDSEVPRQSLRSRFPTEMFSYEQQ